MVQTVGMAEDGRNSSTASGQPPGKTISRTELTDFPQPVRCGFGSYRPPLGHSARTLRLPKADARQLNPRRLCQHSVIRLPSLPSNNLSKLKCRYEARQSHLHAKRPEEVARLTSSEGASVYHLLGPAVLLAIGTVVRIRELQGACERASRSQNLSSDLCPCQIVPHQSLVKRPRRI